MKRVTGLYALIGVVVSCGLFLPAPASASAPTGSWRGVFLSDRTGAGGMVFFESTGERVPSFEGVLTLQPPAPLDSLVFMVRGKFAPSQPPDVFLIKFRGTNRSTAIRAECVWQLLDAAAGPKFGAALWRCSYRIETATGDMMDSGQIAKIRDTGASGVENIGNNWGGHYQDELRADVRPMAMTFAPPPGTVMPGETSFDAAGMVGNPAVDDPSLIHTITGVGELWGVRRFIIVGLIQNGVGSINPCTLVATGMFADAAPGFPGSAHAVFLDTSTDGSIKLGRFDIMRVAH